MNIAFILSQERGGTDLLLQQVARHLEERGVNACGTVQINSEQCVRSPCDMDVKVLPSGPVLRISQNLGRNSKGCRLDPDALETAVTHVEKHLRRGADIMLVNKFGKHEAEGRGFRTPIAEAIANGIPVLVGVNALSLEAFRSFVGSDVLELDPTFKSVELWISNQFSEPELV